MADKTNLGGSDDFDLDSFMDDLDAAESKPKSFVTEFLSGFKTGAADAFKVSTSVKHFMRGALPNGYTRMFGVYDDVLGGLEDIKRDVETRNSRELETILGAIQSQLPKLQDKISGDLYKRIEEKLGNAKDSYARTNNAGGYTSDDDDEVEAEDLVWGQATAAEAQIQMDVHKTVLEAKERSVRDKISQGRHKDISKALGLIADGTQRLAAYNDQVNYRFQRKMLELNMRQYASLRNISRVLTESAEMQQKAFESIIHNTGLIESRKARDALGVKPSQYSVRSNALTASDHRRGFGKAIATKIASSISNVLGVAGGTEAQMLSDVWEMIKDNPGNIIGNIVGKGVTEAAMKHGGKFVGSKFRGKATKLSNKYLGGRHHDFDYFMDNMPAKLTEMLDEASNGGGLKGDFAKFIRGFIPSFAQDKNVKAGGFNTLKEAATFNNLTQRTIVEVIPGYLSRMLQEIRILRTGDKSAGRMEYDFVKGRFSNAKSVDAAIKEKVVSKSNIDYMGYSLDRAVNTMDKGNTLSPEARRLLADRVLRDSHENRVFGAKSYAQAKGYGEKADPKVVKELQDFFATKFKYDKDGNPIFDAETRQLQAEFAEGTHSVRNQVSSPAEMIEELMEMGKTNELRRIGIVRNIDGQDVINYDKLYSYYLDAMGKSDYKPPEEAKEEEQFAYINGKLKSIGKAQKDKLTAFAKKHGVDFSDQRDALKRRYAESGLKGRVDEARRKAGEYADEFERRYAGGDGTEIVKDLKAGAKNKAKQMRDAAKQRYNDSELKGYVDDGIGAAKGAYADMVDNVKERYENFDGDALKEKLLNRANKLAGGEDRLEQMRYHQEMAAKYKRKKGRKAQDRARFHAKKAKEYANPVSAKAVAKQIATATKMDGIYNKLKNARKNLKPTNILEQLKLREETLKKLDKIKDAITPAAVENLLGSVQEKLTKENFDALVDDVRATLNGEDTELRQKISDTANGMMDRAGEMKDKLKDRAGNLHEDILAAHKAMGKGSIMDRARNLRDHLNSKDGILSRVKDLYAKGKEAVLIKAQDLREGRLADAKTGETLETIDDIKGPVINKETKEIVLDTEDIEAGLQDADGIPVKPKGLLGFLNKVFNMGKTSAKIGAAIAKRLTKLAIVAVYDKDAYLPGVDGPVLRQKWVKQGAYFDQYGNVLKNLDALKGTVYDKDLNVVVEADEIPKLVNFDGTKHSAAKKFSIRRGLKNMLVKPAKFIGKKLAKVHKAYTNKVTKPYYNLLGRKAKDWLYGTDEEIAAENAIGSYMGKGRHVSGFSDKPKEESKTRNVLEGILKVLDNRLPGSKAKEGSVEDNLMDENDREAAAKKKQEDKLKEIQERQKGIFEKRRQRQEDAEAEKEAKEDGGINIDLGGDGGSDSDRKKKKGWKKKPKGKLGRLADKMRNSRVGRFGSRVANSKVGRGVGMAARGVGHVARAGLGLATGALGLSSAIGSGLATAGSLALSGVSGAYGLAASAAGLVSLPMLLGAAAIGGIGYLGYKWYQRSKKVAGDLLNLRAAQYGYEGSSDKSTIVDLETVLAKGLSGGKEARVDLAKINPAEIFKILDIDHQSQDEDDRQMTAVAVTWLKDRMIPIFCQWAGALAKLGKENASFASMDKDVPDDLKYALIKMAMEVPNEVYDANADPLDDGDPMEVSLKDIQELASKLMSKYESKATPASIAIAENKGEEKLEEEEEEEEVTSAIKDKEGASGMKAAGAAAAAATVTAKMSGANKLEGNQMIENNPSFLSSLGSLIAGITPVGILASAGKKLFNKFFKTELTDLQRLRILAYGANDTDTAAAEALMEAESHLWKQLGGSGLDMSKLDKAGPEVFKILSPVATKLRDVVKAPELFADWYKKRFLTIFTTYYSDIQRNMPGVSPARIASSMNPTIEAALADNIYGTATMDGNEFFGKYCIFMDDDKLNKDSAEILANSIKLKEKEYLKKKEKADARSGKTQEAKIAEENRKADAVERTTKDKETLEGNTPEKKSVLGSLFDKAKGVASSVVDKIKNFSLSSFFSGSEITTGELGEGGVIGSRGSVFSGFAEGNGGAWDTIPLPTANKSRSAAMPTLKAVEAITGISADLLATFCSIESGFDYLVTAGTSSATGWFQFINGTWDGMIAKYGKKYGLPSDPKPERPLRKDPRINALMGALFLKDNYEYLAKRIGRAPTDTDLYAAHFLGAGTAAKFLTLDQNVIAAKAYPDQARANRNIFYERSGRPRTVGEVYAYMDNLVSKHRVGGNSVNSEKPDDKKVVAEADNLVTNGSMEGQDPAALVKAPEKSGYDKAMDVVNNINPGNSQSVTGGSTPIPLRKTGNNTVSTPEAAEPVQRVSATDSVAISKNKATSEERNQMLNVQIEQLKVQTESRDILRDLRNLLQAGTNPMKTQNTPAPVTPAPVPKQGRSIAQVTPPIRMS